MVSASQPLAVTLLKTSGGPVTALWLLEGLRLAGLGLPPSPSAYVCVCGGGAFLSLLMKRIPAVSGRGWSRGYREHFWQCAQICLVCESLICSRAANSGKTPTVLENPPAGWLKKCQRGMRGGAWQNQPQWVPAIPQHCDPETRGWEGTSQWPRPSASSLLWL